MSSSQQHPRHLSTAARVHPSFLPEMHLQQQSRRVPSKWVASIATVAVAGYGIQTYIQARNTHMAEVQAAEAREAERRRQNEALLDQYGDRSSLEELERAIQFYEKK